MTAPANPPVLTGQSSKKPKHKQRAVSHLTPVHGSNQQKSLLPVPPPSIPITVAPRVCKEEGGRGEEGAGAGAEAVADALAATPVAAAAVQQQPQQDVDLFDITSHVQALRENAKDVEQMLIASMSKVCYKTVLSRPRLTSPSPLALAFPPCPLPSIHLRVFTTPRASTLTFFLPSFLSSSLSLFSLHSSRARTSPK